MGFDDGLENLWTPFVAADWAGCESSCNACGQVCPTGAIRALPLEEKRDARMGLAVVDSQTCLPIAGDTACQLCVDECNGAGYFAIDQQPGGTQVDVDGNPIEGSGQLIPVVNTDKCVGCGLCQTRCYNINVKAEKLLEVSAIVVEAGEGKEDRMSNGSYSKLRREEVANRRKAAQTRQEETGGGEYLVPEDSPIDSPSPLDDDPFGVEDPFGLQGP